MIKKVFFVLTLFSFTVIQAQNKGFVGSYYYTEMEFAEQVHILKPHRFSWQQVYGAVNKDIRGKWNVKNDTLTLVFDPLPGNKHPGTREAVLTDSGDLKLVKAQGKSTDKQSILKRFDKTLPPEKAKKLANPIDYTKQIAARQAQLKKRKKERQRRAKQRRNKRKDYGKYHGYFQNGTTDTSAVLALDAKDNGFSYNKPDPEQEGSPNYREGTYVVKNDTAYLTTNYKQDEIRVYGSKRKQTDVKNIEIYLRNKKTIPMKLKVGDHYEEADFIPSEKFEQESGDLQHLKLQKADTLWVAVDQHHLYSYALRNVGYQKILIRPNKDNTKPWIKQPVYVDNHKEIHGFLSRESCFKKVPDEMLIAPVDTTSPPKVKGDPYFSIPHTNISTL